MKKRYTKWIPIIGIPLQVIYCFDDSVIEHPLIEDGLGGFFGSMIWQCLWVLVLLIEIAHK
jgi:hypothetical protein